MAALELIGLYHDSAETTFRGKLNDV